jgi:hypothetical protein
MLVFAKNRTRVADYVRRFTVMLFAVCGKSNKVICPPSSRSHRCMATERLTARLDIWYVPMPKQFYKIPYLISSVADILALNMDTTTYQPAFTAARWESGEDASSQHFLFYQGPTNTIWTCWFPDLITSYRGNLKTFRGV